MYSSFDNLNPESCHNKVLRKEDVLWQKNKNKIQTRKNVLKNARLDVKAFLTKYGLKKKRYTMH